MVTRKQLDSEHGEAQSTLVPSYGPPYGRKPPTVPTANPTAARKTVGANPALENSPELQNYNDSDGAQLEGRPAAPGQARSGARAGPGHTIAVGAPPSIYAAAGGRSGPRADPGGRPGPQVKIAESTRPPSSESFPLPGRESTQRRENPTNSGLEARETGGGG